MSEPSAWVTITKLRRALELMRSSEGAGVASADHPQVIEALELAHSWTNRQIAEGGE